MLQIILLISKFLISVFGLDKIFRDSVMKNDICQPLSPAPVLEDVDGPPQGQGITAHSILSANWYDRRVFWEHFARHLLTPKKQTQFQSWTLETEP